MSQDISRVLDGWDFDPHELNVRIIQGEDQRPKIQMRIDLGLLQMAMDGRPDGQRPHDCESALDHYMQEAEEYGEGYALSAEALEELFREGLQYYHRYLCLFHLGKYDLVVRDTDRNLRMFAFVLKRARKRRDQWRFDQYRPYVVMMNTRASAMLALEKGDLAAAIAEIDRGRRRIQDFLEHYGRSEEECFELDFLTRWVEELRISGPIGDPEAEAARQPSGGDDDGRRAAVHPDLAELHVQLKQAVEREEYERAAVIRDRIKRIEQTSRESA
jgi:hypothetical protein